MPPLEFTNLPKQAVGEVFNTFRVGKKWADRKVGDILTLKKTDGEPDGEAEVAGVVTGKWDEVKNLAADNHEFGKFPPAEAADLLYDSLKLHYGDELKSNSVFTVIYLRKLEKTA